LKVAFRESFLRDVRAVKEKSVLRRVREVIEHIENVSTPAEIPNLKKLKGQGTYFRIRIGDYRVGVKVEADTVTFVRLLNRKDVYKYFP
jgi:mRNA interferase RelE/StbE